VAVFVHGCFWHQHPGCRKATIPKNNADYWGPKLQRNVRRDQAARLRLEESGWRVLVLWECEIPREEAALRPSWRRS
jgi:DNA mismatch endonuclease (patch repair protein)